tara:strand:+ start:1283 stop:1678 length:396 start_codon:yes stop_codon:yes gene_type:complete
MKNITLTFVRNGHSVYSDGDDYYAHYVHKPTMSKWEILWCFSQCGRHIGSIRKKVEDKWEYQGEVFRYERLEQGLKVEVDLLEADETYESVSRALATPPPDMSPRGPVSFGLPLEVTDTMPNLRENPLGWA